MIVPGVLCALLLGAALYLHYVPVPRHYEQDPIRAQVVDNETGEPIAGAAVVGVWQLSHGGIEETWSVYRYDEAVTDRDGWFQLRGWKLWRKKGEGRLRDEDPDLYIYKPGYKSLSLNNRIAYVQVTGRPGRFGGTVWTPVHTPAPGQVAEKYPGWRWGGAKRYCFWSGKRIGMDRARTTKEEGEALLVCDRLYRFNLNQLNQFWRIWADGWRRVPKEDKTDITPPGAAITLLEREGTL